MSKRERYYANAYYGQPGLGPTGQSESHRQFKSIEIINSDRYPLGQKQNSSTNQPPYHSSSSLTVMGVSNNPVSTLNSDLVTSVSHLPKTIGRASNQDQVVQTQNSGVGDIERPWLHRNGHRRQDSVDAISKRHVPHIPHRENYLLYLNNQHQRIPQTHVPSNYVPHHMRSLSHQNTNSKQSRYKQKKTTR